MVRCTKVYFIGYTLHSFLIMGVQLRKLWSKTFSTLDIEKLFPTSKTEGQTLVSGKVNVILCNFLTRISIWSWMGRENIEYWMIYWRPGFLAVVCMIWLLAHLPPSFSVRKLSLFLCLPVCRQWSLPSGEGGGRGWGGSEPGPLHHPILSGKKFTSFFFRS